MRFLIFTKMRWSRITLVHFVIGCIVFSSASIMGDECDWTGSGLSMLSSERGVVPVYLRCRAGRITWLYPKGALRIILRLPGKNRDFRTCIKVREDKKQPAARLFLEGPRSLLKLYSYDDGSTKSTRCFNSKNGQAAIYVEAMDNDGVTKTVADIEYDLQVLPKNVGYYDPSEECRPCTNEELAHSFCTSDLVTRGIIYAVEDDHTEEISQMSVKITKLIRHTSDENTNGLKNNENESENQIESDNDEDIKKVTISVAKYCGVTHGVGEFVFMARRKLGDLTLQCAPRLEDWIKLVNSFDEGKTHCILRS